MKRLLLALVALFVSASAAAAIDLNTATKDELIALPGIGPAKAQAIVDYRSQHGPFKSVDEVRKVKGIGEKLFIQLKPELSLGTPTRAGAAEQAKVNTEAGSPRSSGVAITREEKAKR